MIHHSFDEEVKHICYETLTPIACRAQHSVRSLVKVTIVDPEIKYLLKII